MPSREGNEGVAPRVRAEQNGGRILTHSPFTSIYAQNPHSEIIMLS